MNLERRVDLFVKDHKNGLSVSQIATKRQSNPRTVRAFLRATGHIKPRIITQQMVFLTIANQWGFNFQEAYDFSGLNRSKGYLLSTEMNLRKEHHFKLDKDRKTILMMKYVPKRGTRRANPSTIKALQGFARDMNLEEVVEWSGLKKGVVKSAWDAVGVSEYLPLIPEVVRAIQAKAWGVPITIAAHYVRKPIEFVELLWNEMNISETIFELFPYEERKRIARESRLVNSGMRATPPIVGAIIGHSRGQTAKKTAKGNNISRRYVNQIWSKIILKPHTLVFNGKHNQIDLTPEVVRVAQAFTCGLPRISGIVYSGTTPDRYDEILAGLPLKRLNVKPRITNLDEIRYKPTKAQLKATPRRVAAIQYHALGYNPKDTAAHLNCSTSNASFIFKDIGLLAYPRHSNPLVDVEKVLSNPKTSRHQTARHQGTTPKTVLLYQRKRGLVPQRLVSETVVRMVQGYATRINQQQTADFAGVSRGTVSVFWNESNIRDIPIPEGPPLNLEELERLYEPPANTIIRATRQVLEVIIGHANGLTFGEIEDFYKRTSGNYGIIAQLIGLRQLTFASDL